MGKKEKKKGFIFKNVTESSQFPLIDVGKPQLFRDIFPYDEVCKVKFDHKIELIDPLMKYTSRTRRSGTASRPGPRSRRSRSRTSSSSCTA